MTTGVVSKRYRSRTRLFLSLGLAVALTTTTPAQAQAPATPPSAVLPWQTAAGGKMAFEVASIRENKDGLSASNPASSNFPLGSTPLYSHNGGRLSIKNMSLAEIIGFAYHLTGMQNNYILYPQLPVWAQTERINIEARAEAGSEPTKDQMRLMVQSLLADRFKLAVHSEIKQTSVYALRMVEPGKLGPQIKLHPADASCTIIRSSDAPPVGPSPLATDGYPPECGYVRTFLEGSTLKYSARGSPIEEIAKLMTVWKNDGVPVLEQTELTGTYDLNLNFEPQTEDDQPPTRASQFGCFGPALVQALKKQLGMKLVSTKGPVDTLVIDHIEKLSEN